MSPRRPRPDTVENTWLCKSIAEQLQILSTVAPDKMDAFCLLLDDVLRMEWTKLGGHTPKAKKGGA
jgi:hypothetical protein